MDTRITRTRQPKAPVVLKYAVYPGTVFSMADGANHFIPSDALIQYYGVDPRECLVVARNMPEAKYNFAKEKALELKLIPLVPQITGDYRIPSAD